MKGTQISSPLFSEILNLYKKLHTVYFSLFNDRGFVITLSKNFFFGISCVCSEFLNIKGWQTANSDYEKGAIHFSFCFYSWYMVLKGNELPYVYAKIKYLEKFNNI